MRAMQIDFAPPSLMRTLARTSALTWSACSIGVLACALAGFNASTLMTQQAACQAALRGAVASAHGVAANMSCLAVKPVAAS